DLKPQGDHDPRSCDYHHHSRTAGRGARRLSRQHAGGSRREGLHRVRPGGRRRRPRRLSDQGRPGHLRGDREVGERRCPQGTCRQVVGNWTWFLSTTAFKPDGTATNSGGPTATWTCASGTVTVRWSHGFVDRVTPSADGASLTINSTLVGTFSAKRL